MPYKDLAILISYDLDYSTCCPS